MLNKIALFFRKYPFLHKILSFIYNKFIIKITSGYYWNCIKYFCTTYVPEKRRLKKYGLKKIKPINSEGWRWGKGLDKAYRRYYVACYNGEKCFIKVARNDATIINEIRTNTHLKKFLSNTDFLTKIFLSDENFCENTGMMAIEFIPELRNFSIPENIDDFDNICKSFTEILELLGIADITHGDIHKGNLMLNGNKPVLLDFGISKIKNLENNIDYKARPGTFYRTDGTKRIYNDAYSFVKMLEKMDIGEEFKNIESYKNIEKMCDSNSFIVDIL